ncbi:hypothetical protein PAXRUDRAFT_168541, partial [Paxillus rubicundulus Ve08.2h10]
WEKQYADKAAETTKVLALKTKFNLAWEKFNVHELSKAVLQPLLLVCSEWKDPEGLGSEATPLTKYWEDMLPLREDNLPEHLDEFIRREGLPENLFIGKKVVMEDSMFEKQYWLFDYTTAILGSSRWLVSHKRSKNLGDLARQWNQLSLFDTAPEPFADKLDHEIETQLKEQWLFARKMLGMEKLVRYAMTDILNP